jgi:hypothetical protein
MSVPVVTAISPTSGPLAGGTSVTITGTGFTGATKVQFGIWKNLGGFDAQSFVVDSATQITAVSPPYTNYNPANVCVTNASGRSYSGTNNPFTYYDIPVPVVTYLGDLSTDLDRVRFAIGDTEVDAGPKPEDENFSDDELNGLLLIEGTWQRAAAAAFENLATLWTNKVTFTAGSQVAANLSDIAAGYRASALEWRSRYGSADSGGAGTCASTRADGYSDDLDNVSGANDW